MATKKKNNIKGAKAEDLSSKLKDLREDLRVLRFKAEGARSKNVKEASGIKKQIARILTELNNK